MLEAKRALRALITERRDAIPAAERRRQSEALHARIRARAEWQKAGVVMLYLGIKSEFDPQALVEEALTEGKTVLLPRILKLARRLEIRSVRSLSHDLVPGAWGLQEPDPKTCPEAALASIDLILVPGLAFDRHGHRLGYGAGYYDRLLSDPHLQACKIAALFLEQFVDSIPVEAHDQAVDVLLLPDEDRKPE